MSGVQLRRRENHAASTADALIKYDGAFYETFKWLAYRKWAGVPTRSPDFQCPHCGEDIANGLAPDADDGVCPHCSGEVFLTDMPGFHQGMGEDAAPITVASDYMLVMEHLMLFTPARLAWNSPDPRLVGDTLFLKDGPLTLRGQYSKLVEPIRAFLQHAKTVGRPVHIVGQEKTGAFVDHLAEIARFAPLQERGQPPAVGFRMIKMEFEHVLAFDREPCPVFHNGPRGGFQISKTVLLDSAEFACMEPQLCVEIKNGNHRRARHPDEHETKKDTPCDDSPAAPVLHYSWSVPAVAAAAAVATAARTRRPRPGRARWT
jgi:hypothetical protein